jgi:hypothetical protein
MRPNITEILHATQRCQASLLLLDTARVFGKSVSYELSLSGE